MNSYLNNLWPVRNFTRTTHEMCEHAIGWQQGEGVKFTSAQVWEQQLWGKTVVRNRLLLSDESYTGRKKHLFFKAVAPALPNPRWLNSCTYVPWRRLIFSPQWARRKKWGREKSKGEERTGRRQTEVGWYLLNSVTALTRNTFCPSAACFYSPFSFHRTRGETSRRIHVYIKGRLLKGQFSPQKMTIQSLSAHWIMKFLWFTKHFGSFAAQQRCSILLHNWRSTKQPKIYLFVMWNLHCSCEARSVSRHRVWRVCRTSFQISLGLLETGPTVSSYFLFGCLVAIKINEYAFLLQLHVCLDWILFLFIQFVASQCDSQVLNL